ncbi:MAG: zinc dependent phospholipase C family protein [Nanoarchaeota archaeon]|nr:zinc dependent phospholipase C family protein [Nanoarchaeota archaeon]
MRTYSHGIIGYLLYLKGTLQQQKLAFWGAMLPDVFLALGYVGHIGIDTWFVDVLHDLFHHSFFHSITKLMHSFVLVLLLLLISYFLFKKWISFFVGMVSHIVVDFLTHQRSGYNHFFPLPFLEVRALVSYHSWWFTIVEHVFVVGFIFWFFYLRKKK